MSYLQRLRQGEFSQKCPHDFLTKLTEGGESASPSPVRQGEVSEKTPIRVTDKADRSPFVSSVSSPPEHISRRRIWRYRVDGRPARVIDPTGADRDAVWRGLLARYGADRVSNLEEIKPRRIR